MLSRMLRNVNFQYQHNVSKVEEIGKPFLEKLGEKSLVLKMNRTLVNTSEN